MMMMMMMMMMMIFLMMIQVKPTTVDEWTKVGYDNDGSAGDLDAEGVLISIFPTKTNNLPRISDVTMDACIPRPGIRVLLSVCLSLCLQKNTQHCNLSLS